MPKIKRNDRAVVGRENLAINKFRVTATDSAHSCPALRHALEWRQSLVIGQVGDTYVCKIN